MFAALPRLAAGRDILAPLVGFLQQTSNIGQFLGPMIIGTFVAHYGWAAAPILLVPLACGAIAISLALRAQLNAR